MIRFHIAAAAGLFIACAASLPAQAQNFPLQPFGVDPMGQPLCQGPLGPGRCADIAAWMQQRNMQPPMFGPMGVPTSMIPQDGQLVAEIAQDCRGEPRCMAAAWGSIEVQRCANGVGVPGGCFGPNGEIMKVINRFVPQNLQPNVILRNMDNDLRNGPGRNNDIVGKDGWVCKTLFGGC
jgi:hypothetical protein